MASELLRKKCPSTREKRDLLNEMPWRAGHTVRRRGSDVVKKKCNHRKWIIRRLTHSYVSTFHRSRLLLCAQWTPEKIEKKKWKGTFSLRVSANINKWKDCDDDDDDYDDWWCYSGASSLAWKATGGGKSSGGAESKSNPAPWLAPGNGLPFLFYFISFYSFFCRAAFFRRRNVSKGLTLNGITELSLLARNNVAVAAAYTPSLEAGIIPRVGCRQKIEQPNKFIDRRPDINTTSRALIRRSPSPPITQKTNR